MNFPQNHRSENLLHFRQIYYFTSPIVLGDMVKKTGAIFDHNDYNGNILL